jgi:hypothetical protein
MVAKNDKTLVVSATVAVFSAISSCLSLATYRFYAQRLCLLGFPEDRFFE